MKKTLTLLSTALATIALSTASQAATPAATAGTTATIAVLDINRIMTESKAAKGLNEQMEKLRTTYETEIAAKEEKLRKEEEQLTKNGASMKEAELEKRKKAFEASVGELQKTVMTKQNQMQNGANEALTTVRDSVVKISGDIAKNKGLQYVQPAAGFLYFSPEVDITNDTIARLDKELPEVKVVLKDAPAPGAGGPATMPVTVPAK
jgi:outer membrane protein